MKAFCGIDWASDHHDIAVVDETGSLLARARISVRSGSFDLSAQSFVLLQAPAIDEGV